MTKGNRKLKVFLCYARVDETLVNSLYKRLVRDGVDVWIDKQKIMAGQEWEDEIRKAIQDSDMVIVCHTKQFNQTGFHHKEVKIILDAAELHPSGDMFIVPVVLEERDVLHQFQRFHPVYLFDKNPPIETFENSYQNLLRAMRFRASSVGATLRVKRKLSSKVSSQRQRNNRLIPDDVLGNWLIKHDLGNNPLWNLNLKNHSYYPNGMARPNWWEDLFDSFPLFVHCPTTEDAQALSRLLREECLPSVNDASIGRLDRDIFPIWVWPQQRIPPQSPLLTVAHSVARTWLNILPVEPHALLNLPLPVQNDLLELLCWSQGLDVLVSLVRLNGVTENENTQTLIRRLAGFDGNLLTTVIPQDSNLISWISIRPSGNNQTCLILSGDDLFSGTHTRWFDQFGSLISNLLHNGIVAKVFSSLSPGVSLHLQEMTLSWSETQLKRSLEGQFDAAMHPDAKLMGKAIHFHELFGPGASETDTTDRLISASQNSLARMLTLGNRLLQKHCWKNASEKYLSIKELNDILG